MILFPYDDYACRSFRRSAIVTIIIDGYNLIGTGHRNLESAREALIQSLIAYKAKRTNEIVVVFDGHKSGMGPQSRAVRGGVEIIYSGLGDSADSVIKRMVSAGKKDRIVVTSDREIARSAWANDAVPIDSGHFARILEHAGVQGSEPDVMSDDDDVYDEPQRGGNPHRLSKKDRALQRALGKL